MAGNKRLDKALKGAHVVPLYPDSKIVFMSDCHRGIGNHADNFTNNQTLYNAALSYYYQQDFTYIEVGDGDELWENRNIDYIINTHCDTFAILSEFYNDYRLFMIYGNHDIAKKKTKTMQQFSSYYNECVRKQGRLFPGITVYEALLLRDSVSQYDIFVTHGHQGDFLNDPLWRVARFFVRYLWQPLELIGFQDPTSSSLNKKKRGKVEQGLKKWCEQRHQIMICGHTHSPAFSEPGEAPYFNDGCCVNPHYITSIEIQGNKIALVKWIIKTDKNLHLYVGRDIVQGPEYLVRYFQSKR